MILRKALRSGVAAACIISVAAPASLAAPAVDAIARRGVPEVRVATTERFSRVEIRGRAVAVRQEGQTVTLTFAAGSDPDIARLRTSPPKWFKSAEKRRSGGRLQVLLTLADNAGAKIGTADGATYINAFEKPEVVEAAPVAVVAVAEPVRPDPLPPGGVVQMAAKAVGGQVQFSFPFANPAGDELGVRGFLSNWHAPPQ